MEEPSLRGVIDLHVHAAPDVITRKTDELSLAKHAQTAGMRSVLLKNHYTQTADRAWLVRRATGFEAYGGLVLNESVGGLNPSAVEAAIKLGAKEVWMPTVSSAHHLKITGGDPARGITILRNGELVAEAKRIVEMVAGADMILGTGHLSPQESQRLVDYASGLHAKVLVTHPESWLVQMPLSTQRELAAKGAILEHCYLSTLDKQGIAMRELAEQIKAVGPEHCVLATDLGQENNPHPAEGLLSYMQSIHRLGFTTQEIDAMTRKTPAKLLGITE